jgi:hypothetical protein
VIFYTRSSHRASTLKSGLLEPVLVKGAGKQAIARVPREFQISHQLQLDLKIPELGSDALFALSA